MQDNAFAEVSSLKAGSQILKMSHISKRYQGVQALDKVELDVRSGEIHASALSGPMAPESRPCSRFFLGSLTRMREPFFFMVSESQLNHHEVLKNWVFL